MNKTILISIIVIILIILVGGYYIYNGSTYNTKAPAGENSVTNPNDNPPINPETGGKFYKIEIKNFAFSPSALTIKKGDTVSWTNKDSVPHQIKSAVFNSAVLSTGESFQFDFSTVGEYNYSCAIHPSMLGKITVTQ